MKSFNEILKSTGLSDASAKASDLRALAPEPAFEDEDECSH
jgi:hypothetical protein